jgi:hypothetical protein
MKCKNLDCSCEHIASISAKHDDRAGFRILGTDVEKYNGIPHVGSLGGDYTNLSICIQCGLVQNWEPFTLEEAIEAIAGE